MRSFKEFKDEYRIVEVDLLAEYLQERLGDRFSYNEDEVLESIGTACMTCYLDSKEFQIEFWDECSLEVSTRQDTKDILEELTPIFNEVMDTTPICSYDSLPDGEKIENSFSTIDWRTRCYEEEERIEDIVYGRAYKQSFHNIKLYNGKNLLDYIKCDAYSKYLVKEYNELDLYIAISTMTDYINNLKMRMNTNIIPDFDVKKLEEIRDYMIYCTTKFGVGLDTPGNLKQSVVYESSFVDWANYYFNHFSNVLTDADREAYMDAKANRKDTSSFMPEKNWAAAKENAVKLLKK